jgi:hypothetical protein
MSSFTANASTSLIEKKFNMTDKKWEEKSKSYPWDKRTIPTEFSTVQEKSKMPVSCVDWWNTRSPLFCCLFPFAKCYTGAKTVDGTDPSVWKEQLEKHKNGPESMRGLWWLKYNHAHEQLVTIFNESEFIGTMNKDGTKGHGRWERSLKTNWSRDNTCFGYILAINARAKDPKVGGLYNMDDGILTLDPGKQWVYRVNDNEWWKIHYEGNIGEEGEQDVNFMYQWLKVLDKNGEPTEHWSEYVKWSMDPLPHRNGCEPCCTCWPVGLKQPEIFQNMCRPNPKQIVMFRD